MKVLLYDIETTPILGYTWGTYQTDVISIARDWQMICFAYKWLDEKKTHFVRPDLDCPWDDVEMVQKLWDLLNEADVVVGHNAARFDIKKTNALFIRHGLTPPSPYRVIDTLTVAKQNFANSSNRLNALGELYKIGKKVEHEGFMKLFHECMEMNDERYWKKMEKYNLQDVRLLEKLYIKLRPWIKSHPVDLDNPEGCVKCGSKNLVRRGHRDTNTYRYARYTCQDCGAWMRGRVRIPLDKPKYTN